MGKKIALVGHCGPDSSYLRLAVGRAERGVQVVAADDSQELEALLKEGVDLLLLNRVLDYGFNETEGVEIIKKLRGRYPELKMMLISNYAESQAEAVAAGALMGFGKREIGSPKAAELLREALAEYPARKA